MTDVVQWKMDPGLAVEEVLSFQVGLLLQLPRPPVLVLKVDRPGFVVLDFRKAGAARTRDDLVVFDSHEVAALIEAVEQDRFLEADFKRVCDAKLEDPRWCLTREVALGDVPGILSKPPVSQKRTTSWFLGRIGARLQSVRV